MVHKASIIWILNSLFVFLMSFVKSKIWFDFSSLAILPDGGVVVAYHDSTDPNTDPMFGIELELPENYFFSINT